MFFPRCSWEVRLGRRSKGDETKARMRRRGRWSSREEEEEAEKTKYFEVVLRVSLLAETDSIQPIKLEASGSLTRSRIRPKTQQCMLGYVKCQQKP